MTTTTVMTRRFGLVLAMAALTACGGSPATLQELQITPAVTEVTENLSAPVVATAVYSDGTTQDVTAQVAWSTVDRAVAAADAGLVQAGVPGRTSLVASYEGLQTTARVVVIAATLVSLEVAVDASSVPAGLTARLTVTGLFTDHRTRDVTTAVEAWSAIGDVVQVEAGGLVRGVRPGVGQVRAAIGAQTRDVEVLVTEATPVGVAIVGIPAQLAAGDAVPFQVMAILSDGSELDVSTDVASTIDDPTIVALQDVRYGRGRQYLSVLQAGSTTLRTRYGEFTATLALQVN